MDEDKAKNSKRSRINLHPFSGVIIIFLDMIFWGANAVTLGLGTFPVALILLMITTVSVSSIQIFLDDDTYGEGVSKGVFSGVLTAMPTPIMGTGLGALVITLSGLSKFNFGGK